MNQGPVISKKILAIKLRELGDTAIWTSALTALKRAYPGAELHVLVKSEVAPILEGHPAIDRCHGLSSTKAFGLPLKLRELRSEKFDLVLGFHATTSLCRWIFLLGSPQRALHHHSWPFTPRLSSFEVPNAGKLEDAISRDFELLRAIGLDHPAGPTNLHVTPKEKEWARNELKSKGITFENPLVVLLPGARIETKRYPKDLWTQVAEKLVLKREMDVFVIADSEVSREWGIPELGRKFGFATFDHVTLREMMALMSCASNALANDSGPHHLAVALNLKTVVLFGPTCIGDWNPYPADRHQALRVEVDCRPYGPRGDSQFQYCTLNHCDHLSCLRKLSPEKVIEAIRLNVAQ